MSTASAMLRRLPSPETVLPPLLAVVAGLLYAGPFVSRHLWPLALVAFVPLFVAIRDAGPRRALALGWLMSSVANGVGSSYLIATIEDFTGAPLPVALAVQLVFALAHGPPFAFVAWAVARARGRGWPLWLVAPLALVVSETWIPKLFPYLTGSAIRPFTLAIQTAELFTTHGVTVVVMVCNVGVLGLIDLLILRRGGGRVVAGTAAVLALNLVYGAVRLSGIEARMAEAPTLRVGIAQYNYGGDERVVQFPKAHSLLKRQTAELARDGALLVVWPEVAFIPTLSRDETMANARVTGGAITSVLTGARREGVGSANGKTHLRNAAVLIGPDFAIQGVYEKRMLMPFGEYVPGQRLWPGVLTLFPDRGWYEPGDPPEPMALGEHHLALTICYEIMFPNEARKSFLGPEGPADLLVNITNDSWFGQSAENWQHLTSAAMRAVELRRSMVRSTSTGISALILPTGEALQEAPYGQVQTLVGDLPLLSGMSLVARAGQWFCWVCLALLLPLLWVHRPWVHRGRAG